MPVCMHACIYLFSVCHLGSGHSELLRLSQPQTHVKTCVFTIESPNMLRWRPQQHTKKHVFERKVTLDTQSPQKIKHMFITPPPPRGSKAHLYGYMRLYMAIYAYIHPKICILGIGVCILGVWTCILSVWTHILGV